MNRHQLRLEAPATGFLEAFLLGNGRLGVAVGGGRDGETFDVNDDTLWSGGPWRDPGHPRAAELLAEVRQAVADSDWESADRLARELQSPDRSQSYVPVGRLAVTYDPQPAIVAEYERVLDMAHGIATSHLTSGSQTTTFVSAPDGVMVSTTSAEVTSPTFTSPHPLEVDEVVEREGVHWVIAAGRAPADVLPEWVHDAEHPIRYADDSPADDGTVSAGMGFAFVAAIEKHGPGTRIIATTETGFRGWDARPLGAVQQLIEAASARVRGALEADADDLLQRHVRDHRSYFDRVDLDLGEGEHPEAAETLFDLGRYLLVASSRPGTQAANLQGIWNVDPRPHWSSNYTTNINVQMNYWGAEVLGLGDVHEPMMTFVSELTHAGAATAAGRYGAAGSAAHHNVDLWRFSAPVAGHPVWANWPSALPWLAAHTWQHFEYGSADDAFVETIALPVHRAVAQFVLHHLVEDEHGRLIASPSTSPENQFVADDSERHAVSAGAAMDQELAFELLAHYLALAERPAGGDIADEELSDRVREALSRISEPLIVDAVLQEWRAGQHPAEPGHRHLSHLYGIYPGDRLLAPSQNAGLDAAVAAFRARLAAGTGHTAWSQAWVLCLAARLRDRDLAEESISELVHGLSSSALLTEHPMPDAPGGMIFQIDGNLGAVAGIAELLLQSHRGRIVLLPALPGAWQEGGFRGLRARGGIRVDARWRAGELLDAHLSAQEAGPIEVEVPARTVEVTLDDSRIDVAVERLADRDAWLVRWRADAGRTYRIRSAR